MSKIRQTKALPDDLTSKRCSRNHGAVKKPSLALSGSQLNLSKREPSPRIQSAHKPTYRASFAWQRPASADAAAMRRLNTSPCSSVRSCLTLCQQAGFCGSDALLQEASTGRRQHIRKKDKELSNEAAEILEPEYMRYAYTAESAQLLESLLREPWQSGESTPEKLTQDSPKVLQFTEEKLIDTNRTSSSEHEPSKDSGRTGSNSFLQSEIDIKFKRWFPEPIEDNCQLIDLSQEPESEKKEVIPSPRESTLEDLENILQEIENEDDRNKPLTPPPSARTTDKKSAQISDIFNYLDQAEKCSDIVNQPSRVTVEPVRLESDIPRMEELLCRSSVDLAQEVLSLRLQAEEQADAIKLLQQTIHELKQSAKEKQAAHQAELNQAANDAEAAQLRHQKLAKQFLAEKKTLNEKMSKMMMEIKAAEERHQRNLKAIEERHLVELQRVKETHAAAEKLKREKWIDVKTQKIKEMTVKGLEPELSRMAARQQQELTELRNLHRSELEAVELRAARRTTELMDELRAELTRDKEDCLQREVVVQRTKWEKRLEEENRLHEQETRRLKDELRHERERLNGLEIHVQEQLAEGRRSAERERERDRANITREWQEKMDELARQHQIELKNLKEALEMEKDIWMDNYKKLQAKKFLDREADIRHQYKRERDRDIEIAIERMETEATKARLELTEASENRLKRLREKFEAEVKELETECAMLRTKLAELKQQFADKEDENTELNGQIRHLQHEFSQLKKLCDEMTEERSDLRKILRAELNDQLMEAQSLTDGLRQEMAQLKTMHAVELAKRESAIERIRAEKEEELHRVYDRVRITIRKKDEAFEAQKEQCKVAMERCSHLKQMLDNQRKNLLL